MYTLSHEQWLHITQATKTGRTQFPAESWKHKTLCFKKKTTNQTSQHGKEWKNFIFLHFIYTRTPEKPCEAPKGSWLLGFLKPWVWGELQLRTESRRGSSSPWEVIIYTNCFVQIDSIWGCCSVLRVWQAFIYINFNIQAFFSFKKKLTRWIKKFKK